MAWGFVPRFFQHLEEDLDVVENVLMSVFAGALELADGERMATFAFPALLLLFLGQLVFDLSNHLIVQTRSHISPILLLPRGKKKRRYHRRDFPDTNNNVISTIESAHPEETTDVVDMSVDVDERGENGFEGRKETFVVKTVFIFVQDVKEKLLTADVRCTMRVTAAVSKGSYLLSAYVYVCECVCVCACV